MPNSSADDNIVDDAIEIARLAGLSALDYGRQKKAAAERLGVDLADLNAAVNQARKAAEPGGGKGKGAKAGTGRPLALADRIPCPEEVDGAELLDEFTSILRRYVVMAPAAACATALWVLHTFCFGAQMITPRLIIKSVEMRCGKTTLLMLIGELCERPVPSANITAAALFRTIEQVQPTILIDEADAFAKDDNELRGVLNAGFMKGGQVIRTVGDSHDIAVFSCWSPAAFATIGKLWSTLEDRSISITLQRRQKSEKIAKLQAHQLGQFAGAAGRAARWAVDHTDQVAMGDPETPATLNDRAGDCWRILLAIADLCGGPWPARARAAALELSGSNDDAETTGIQLLTDLRELFDPAATDDDPDPEPKDVLFTTEIVAALAQREDRRWPEYKGGKPITGRQIAAILKGFKIPTNRTVRRHPKTEKGYYRKWFDDAFARYLPERD
jgi:putative DNA primase/helicase